MTVPRSIGVYDIERELGRGGMGVVYRGIDRRLDRAVAIKVLHDHLRRDSTFFSRFEREAKALAALSHPNIASILALEECDGLWFMVLEFVTGRSLADRLSIGAIPLAETLDISAQVVRAVEAAHRQRIIHRDLKPGNIHVRDDGMVKVLDFGLSKTLPDIGMESEAATVVAGGGTIDGHMLGTPGYMSPEQARGRPVGPPGDIFSWGCILYECLTGGQAFGGESIADCVAAVLRSEPDWSAMPRETPRRVEELLRACLAKRIEDRPASFSEVRNELETAIAETSTIGRSIAAIEMARPTKRTALPTTNLPEPTAAMVCRDRDVTAIASKLETPGVVTLTGPAGQGRSRLALGAARHVAGAFEGGRWLVRCDRRLPPGAVGSLLAAAIGAAEDRDRGLEAGLVAAIADRPILIVVDDAHIDATSVALMEQLAESCPGLRVLATAPEGLGVEGERVHIVRPLASPSPTDEAAVATPGSFEAAGMFMQRASAAGSARPSPAEAATIATLCRKIGGLPLAIQLMASRPSSVTLDALSQQVDVRLRLASATATTPQQARLSAVVSWRLDLLSSAERAVFRRLRAFAGAFRPEAVAAVCADGHIVSATAAMAAFQSLAAQGIINEETPHSPTPGERRYRMSATLLAAAEDALDEAGERPVVFDRHLRYFCDVASRHAPELNGRHGERALAAMVADLADLTAALWWGLSPGADSQACVRLAAAMGPMWAAARQWRHGWGWLDRVLAMCAAFEPSEDQARVLESAGRLAQAFGDEAGSEHALERSRAMLAALGKGSS